MTDTTQDPQGKSTETPDPSKSQDGESTQTKETSVKETETSLPEKFKGKTADQIARDYQELEKVHGRHSNEVKEYREKLTQWESLGKVIESNPALYKQIEEEITRLSGQNRSEPERHDDVRVATENQIVKNFEEKFAINYLSSDRRKEINSRIADELVEMLDPGGTKKKREVIDSIPVDKLERYLDKAYYLATKGDREERGRAEAILEARQNNEASFGSIPSSSVNRSKIQLTEDEKKVARKQGISEEDYLKEKIAINK